MNEHHAILLYADSLESSQVPDVYKVQSPDVLHIVTDRLSIDNARELTLLASQTPFAAAFRVFVVFAHDIAVEAQHALLKLLEEPPKSARFYLIIPSGSFLLPTLRSRLHEEQADALSDGYADAFMIFKNASYAERLGQIADLTKRKDIGSIELILRGCEKEAEETGAKHEVLMRAVVSARAHSGTRGASLKMLLEDLALSLPV